MQPLIRFDQVTFTYPRAEGAGLPALRGVSLAVQHGEFVAVVGANGSGKSTFARLAAALLTPTQGSVQVLGVDTRAARPQTRAAVGMVFQFPEDQIVSTTVEEDVAFGPENLALPPEVIRARVADALREVGLWEARRRPPHLLSAGQIQRLALAGVLALRPRCVIFDEAATMLDPAGRHTLRTAMQRLCAEGVTVLTITHDMDEAALAGRVLVFADGALAMDGPPAEIFADPDRIQALRLALPTAQQAALALRPWFGADFARQPLPLRLPDLLSALPRSPRVGEPAPLACADDPAVGDYIDVQGLGHIYMRGTPLAQRALQDVNLRAGQQTVHGLLGATGSGKSTLLQHLNGLLRPQEGRVRVGPFDLNDPHLERRTVVRQVGLVFQNPEAQFFAHFVGDEIAYGPRQYPREEALAERVRWAMQQVGLDFAAFKDRPLFTLSGGERRKVALASTLALRPAVLLLDEPTAGLDPRSRLDVLARLDELRAAGMTMLLSSHQMEDLAALADHLTILQDGHSARSGPTARIFAAPDLAQYGVEPPAALRVADGLRAQGWPVPLAALSLDAITAALAERPA